MNKVLNKIKKDRKRKLISSILLLLVFLGLVALVVLYIVEEKTDSSDMLPVFSFIILIPIIIVMIVKIIKNIKIIINPEKDPAIIKWGSAEYIESILDEIEKTKIYEDGRIIISENYFYNGKDLDTIVSKKQVINIYKKAYKVNGVIDYYNLVISDLHKTYYYRFERNQMELMDKVIGYIVSNKKN